MQQYFIDFEIRVGETFSMKNADDCFHLKKVMRAKIGTRVEIVSNCIVYECEVCEIEPSLSLYVITYKKRDVELPVHVTIIQGLPKLDKMDLIIQKGTELGASAFIPWGAKRSIVKYDIKKAKQKQLRWQKIAKEAAEQAHRNMIPEILETVSTNELIQQLSYFDAILIGSERLAKEQTERQLFIQTLAQYQKGSRIACIIGPEGGIDEMEFQHFIDHGALEMSFGPRILRTETASLYFLSIVSFMYE